jgi:hypothetical protein
MTKAIIAAVCLVLAASAITASVLIVAGQEEQDSQEQLIWPGRAEPTAAAAAPDSSPTPAATPEPSPEPTAPPITPQATWGALGCVDCPVKAGDQLRVTAEDIQLGKDGKYYVPDRGDGCAYREVEWGPGEGSSWATLYDPACEVFWVYRPVIGEVQAWTP